MAFEAMVMGIFNQYDTDGNGEMNKKETMAFVRDVTKKTGGGKFDEEAFEEMWEKFNTS